MIKGNIYSLRDRRVKSRGSSVIETKQSGIGGCIRRIGLNWKLQLQSVHIVTSRYYCLLPACLFPCFYQMINIFHMFSLETQDYHPRTFWFRKQFVPLMSACTGMIFSSCTSLSDSSITLLGFALGLRIRVPRLTSSGFMPRVTSSSYLALDFQLVMLGYEWDIGHFHGAQRPEVDCFRSTSFGLPESEPATSDPLSHVDKEKTDILMYCTGGIRCDIYSSILRQKGFQNLFTLKGGVSHYLQKEGPFAWVGNLFVFDSRLSLPPSTYNPNTTINGENTRLLPEFNSSTFARCYICQSHLSDLKHRNCANIDCNRLFLSCSKCQMDVRGCCCLDCTKAPRLRPIQPTQDRYEKWHIYRDHNIQKESDQSSMEHSQV
ncbi:Rhodanese-like domain-containing protein 8 [Ranunculus cassubicifolius]